LQKNIVTFGELFLKPSGTIRPEGTRQIDIKKLSTIIDIETGAVHDPERMR